MTSTFRLLQGLGAAAIAASCLIGAGGARAQTVPAQDVFGVGQLLFSSRSLREQSGSVAFRPGRDPGPLPVGDWLFSPSISVGAFFDDNLYATRFNKISDIGIRIRPTITATRLTGIHDTTIYGTADGRAFANNPRVDTAQGTIGVTHRYEITRDLVARFQAEYGRGADEYGQAFTSEALRGTLVPPVPFDQIFLSSSIRKDFAQFFAGLGTSFSSLRYDTVTDNLGTRYDQSLRDQTDIRLIGRGGYKFSPALYAFVEPSLIWQQFKVSDLNTHGYRVVAGLGSERISLFSGEIFGGYQTQDFDAGGALAGEGPVFGGRVTWSPTRDIALTAVVERSIGFSTIGAGLNRLNTSIGLDPTFQSNVLDAVQQISSETTTVGLQGSVSLTRELSADVAGGYQVTKFTGSTETELLSAQLGLKYLMLRNLGLRLDYAFSHATAGDPLYTKNRVTLGVFGQL